MTTHLDIGNGNNILTFDDADYDIVGGDGNNTLTLGGGTDQLALGNGNNSLTLGGGADQITAGTGNNTITLNGSGADSITVAGGNNSITVGDGADVIVAGDGMNTVTAGDGNDTVTIGNGSSQVTTGNGNSTIIVGSGSNDTIHAGNGRNSITIGNGSADVVHTGAGGNTVYVSAAAIGSDSILGALNTSDGTRNQVNLTSAGAVNPIGVSGFDTYQLSNAGPNTISLADANYARIPAAAITVVDGNSGDAVNASTLTGANSLVVVGGTGYDTAALGYAKTQSILTLNQNGSWTIGHGIGVDTFTAVEQLNFADGGQFTTPGNVTGFQTLNLTPGFTQVAGVIGDESLAYNAPGTTLRVHGLQDATTVTGFAPGDTLDLAGITGAVLNTDVNGTTVTVGAASLAFGVAPAGSVYKLYGDAHGGTEVLLDSPPPANAIEYTDTVTHTNSVATGDAYTGPVDYLQRQFIYAGTDSAAIRANTPNVFLKGGPGDDALQVTGGNNVLDGGTGSNFLVGGTGADGGSDAFFVDGRGGVTTWSTIVNFHQGDQVTIWGFHAGVSTDPYTASDGAAGYTGLTIHSELNGPGTGVQLSATFAGLTQATADAHFTMSTGTLQPGTAGATDYLQIQYNR